MIAEKQEKASTWSKIAEARILQALDVKTLGQAYDMVVVMEIDHPTYESQVEVQGIKRITSSSSGMVVIELVAPITICNPEAEGEIVIKTLELTANQIRWRAPYSKVGFGPIFGYLYKTLAVRFYSKKGE